MFMSIMYHHVNSDRCSNPVEMLEQHLRYIKANFKTVFPGEAILGDTVCLTFDDAYADFYYLIFPLLKKYNLKALLAVPSQYILDDTDNSPSKRMGFEHNDLFDNYQQATFCTYKELAEMLLSGLVQIGSHSHSHVNLLSEGVDVSSELMRSKQILEDKLNIAVNSFVFPFGKYNPSVLRMAREYYPYVFRIGNAIHANFSGIHDVIYRVKGDELKSPDAIFKPTQIFKYRFKALIKRLAHG